METLAGKDYSGSVAGGVGLLRFRKNTANSMTMTFGMVGERPSTVVLTLVDRDVAALSYLEGPGIAVRGVRRVHNQIDIKTDGFVIEWNASAGCVVAPGSRIGCFFSRLTSAGGLQITIFQVKGGDILENPSSITDGQVLFKTF